MTAEWQILPPRYVKVLGRIGLDRAPPRAQGECEVVRGTPLVGLRKAGSGTEFLASLAVSQTTWLQGITGANILRSSSAEGEYARIICASDGSLQLVPP